MDRGAWQAIVHGIAKHQTQLMRLSTDTRDHLVSHRSLRLCFTSLVFEVLLIFFHSFFSIVLRLDSFSESIHQIHYLSFHELLLLNE